MGFVCCGSLYILVTRARRANALELETIIKEFEKKKEKKTALIIYYS